MYLNAPPVVGRGRQAGGRRAAAIPVAGWEHINLTGDYVRRQSRRRRLALRMPGKPSVRFFLDSYPHGSSKAEREDGRPISPASWGTRPARGPSATAHERRRSRSFQAAREAERGREAARQGRMRPVAGCYGRLTREGRGCCLHGSAVVSGRGPAAVLIDRHPFRSFNVLDRASFFANPSTITSESLARTLRPTGFLSKASIAAPRNSGRSGACSTVPLRLPASLSPACLQARPQQK